MTAVDYNEMNTELCEKAREACGLSAEELSRVTGGSDVPLPPPCPAPDAAIVERARQELGRPYQWGAVGPEAYDCSGLVSYCLTGVHARLGTTFTFMGWPRVGEPRPGDICTSNEHCGIYIGGGQMIHIQQPGDAVKIGGVQYGMIYVRRP